MRLRQLRRRSKNYVYVGRTEKVRSSLMGILYFFPSPICRCLQLQYDIAGDEGEGVWGRLRAFGGVQEELAVYVARRDVWY